jgi:cytochrome P450
MLGAERSKVLGLFERTTWPTRDPFPEEEVKQRLHTALIAGHTPTERTVALVALLRATGLLAKVVRTEDRRTLKARAKELAEGDWAAEAVKQAIEEVVAATTAAAVAAMGAASSSVIRRAARAASA